MTNDRIQLDRRDGNLTLLTIDRPPANALNVSILEELDRKLDALAADGQTRALIVTGAGKIFSAGMDLKELQDFDAADQRAVVEGLNRTFATVYGLPFPVIAAVNGPAIAGGLFFVLVSDYRVASQTARLGLAEVRVGLRFPIGPLEIARAELSAAAARRLLLGGGNMTAETAERLGIVDECTPADEVLPRAFAVARDYATIPPGTFAAVKAQLRGDAIRRIRIAVERREEPLLEGWFSEETREAARAQLKSAGRK